VFNEVAGLTAVLDSLLEQDYERLPIIVCENGSSDGTLEVAREYAVQDDRIEVNGKARTADKQTVERRSRGVLVLASLGGHLAAESRTASTAQTVSAVLHRPRSGLAAPARGPRSLRAWAADVHSRPSTPGD
jgi:glycosyltransferase involved in cell wall biosynthesis